MVSAHRTFTPRLEELESRVTPSRWSPPPVPPSVPPSDWYAQHFTDAGVAAQVRTAHADAVVTRSELAALFETTDNAGLTAKEVQSLQALSPNADYLGLNEPLRCMAERIASSLAATTTPDTAAQPVRQWLLGTVRPAANGVYRQLDGTLFVDGISYTDARQGKAADCWLIAAFAEVAAQRPDAIAARFVDAGEDVWFVSFCRGSSREWVTVDNWLPCNPDGSLVYAKAVDGELWAALLEKAYAQWTRTDYTRGAFANGGHSNLAVMALTGEYCQTITLSQWTPEALGAVFSLGGFVCFDTLPTARSPVVNYHCYALVGYDSATQTFTLYNPWGVGPRSLLAEYPGVVSLTWQQMQACLY